MYAHIFVYIYMYICIYKNIYRYIHMKIYLFESIVRERQGSVFYLLVHS